MIFMWPKEYMEQLLVMDTYNSLDTLTAPSGAKRGREVLSSCIRAMVSFQMTQISRKPRGYAIYHFFWLIMVKFLEYMQKIEL